MSDKEIDMVPYWISSHPVNMWAIFKEKRTENTHFTAA
jgi:hypothetical protein